MKFNIGCGKNILPDYINVDAFPLEASIRTGTLTDIPAEDGTADEILAEHVFEHLAFEEEETAWREVYRALKSGGILVIEVPDFEWVCAKFLEAKDEFREFYTVGSVDHYFGNGRDVGQRWSILTTMFFGNQNGAGQYHKTAYTEPKIRAIADSLGMTVIDVKTYDNKGGQALRMTLRKNP
tara:strand:- start:339 stop:881 length:543 start_codon:yes stop_codon:yes gene_type:complete